MTPQAITEIPTREVHIPIPPSPALRSVAPRARPESHVGRAPSQPVLMGALLENHRFKSSSKSLDLLIALTVHVALIGAPILPGLYFTATLSSKEFSSMILVAPPPPPPPPPAPAAGIVKTQAPRRLLSGGKLLAPNFVPKEVAILKEAPLEPDAFEGVAGGVPGGVASGQMGGVLGGVLGGIGAMRPVPAPIDPHAKKIVRVGGRIRQPKLIKKVNPEFPSIARAAHMTGDVVVDAIIDEQGNVTDMKIISGQVVFYKEALAALSEWKYEPTYLNDQPVSVQLIVTITFRLSGAE